MPWQASIRVWLHGLPGTPPEGMLEELLRLMVPPDSEKLRELVFKSMVAGYNIGGEHTTRGIGKEWRRAVKRATGTASVREAEEPFTGRIAKGRYKPGRWGGATLAEYLDTGREWNQERRTGGWNLRDENILNATRRAATRVTGEVTQSMLDDARDVLGSAFYRRGLGPAEVAEELDGIFPPTYAMRHEAIARTEMAGAYSDAQDAAFENAGIARRQWLAFLDFRTRSDHKALHGTITNVGEPWTISGDSIPKPGMGPPRQAIRCRCDMLAVFDEETELPKQPWLGEDVEEYKKGVGSEKLATISGARPPDAKAGELAPLGEAPEQPVLVSIAPDVPTGFAVPAELDEDAILAERLARYQEFLIPGEKPHGAWGSVIGNTFGLSFNGPLSPRLIEALAELAARGGLPVPDKIIPAISDPVAPSMKRKLPAVSESKYWADGATGRVKVGLLSEEDWLSDLTAPEAEALQAWTHASWEELEEVSRRGEEVRDFFGDEFFEQVAAIDAVLARAEPFEGAVFRGLTELPGGERAFLATLQPGQVISLRSIQSASYKPAFAEEWIKHQAGDPEDSVVLEIRDNKSGVLIEELSEIDQGEVLLRKHASYRVVEVRSVAGKPLRVVLDEIEPQ